jgi:hypothetical protein
MLPEGKEAVFVSSGCERKNSVFYLGAHVLAILFLMYGVKTRPFINYSLKTQLN